MSQGSKILDPELREVVETIRQTVDPRQFADPVDSRAKTYICPWCGSGTGPHKTGMQYKEGQNVLFCSNCNRPYDAIALYQKRHGATWGAAVHELSGGTSHKRITRTSPLSAEVEEKPAKDHTAYYAECRPRITDPRAVKYLQGRGITVETAKLFGWGFDPAADTAETGKYFCPRLIMPSGKGHYVGRRVDGKNEAAKLNSKGGSAGLTNLGEMDKPGQVFVCEGAISAASVYEAGGGLPVVLNSADNKGKFLEYIKEHRPKALLLLALDDDSKGRKTTDDIAKALAEMKIPYRVTHGLADGDKDSNDLWVENPEQFRKQVQMAMDPETRPQENPFDGFLQRIKEGTYKAVKTNITEFDDFLGGGFVPGKLTLIGAAPGMGKTAICQWLTESMAERNPELTALFLSLEMSGDEMRARSLARIIYEHELGNLSTMDILQGRSMDTIQKGIDKYLSLIGNRVQYNPGQNGECSQGRGLKQILETIGKAGNVDVIVVDYLQLIDAKRQTEADNIKDSLSALRKMAQERHCIMLVVMATNRASNKANSTDLMSGRGSSDIEFTGDNVLIIGNEIRIEMEDKKEIEVPTGRRYIHAGKARLAEVDRKLYFRFDGKHMRPYEWDLPMGREATRQEQKICEDLTV